MRQCNTDPARTPAMQYLINYLKGSLGCIVKENLEVLLQVSAVFRHLLLKQLEQAVEGNLTEHCLGLLWWGKTTMRCYHDNTN